MVSFSVLRSVQNIGTRRVLVDGIGTTSGISTTVLRQSDEVKNGLFRVEDEGRFIGVGKYLRRLSVSRDKGVLSGPPVRHGEVGEDDDD